MGINNNTWKSGIIDFYRQINDDSDKKQSQNSLGKHFTCSFMKDNIFSLTRAKEKTLT